ncbi:MAG: OmpH family outer membrane protein [Spirochaetes bacterium]|nr:OmpH family outer membrane protein [Spirochaetota bacterium]
MKRSTITLVLFVFIAALIVPATGLSLTLVRVGYIDLDLIIDTYTTKYLETEIQTRNEFISMLQGRYSSGYFDLTDSERFEIQLKIDDQREVIDMLHYNLFLWENSKEMKDELIYQILQRDIMEAIRKTSELEGFSLILDNTGNFIYGSDDVNLTNKVLFRLDERLLDIQENEPKAPLSLELEEEELIETPTNAPDETEDNN